MVENEVYVYSLNSGQKEQILNMSIVEKNVCFRIKNPDGQNFIAYVSLPNFKKVSKAFDKAKTLNELLLILHHTIEGGNITLTEDKEGPSIDLIFSIKLASGNYPPFAVKLDLDDEDSLNENSENNENIENKENIENNENIESTENIENNINSLPPKFDYRGNVEVEKKYGKSTKNTTEYEKPIVQPNYKKPILQLEYIEPVLQVHYPDGTTKSTPLPPRIQTVDGKTPNISEEQFKLIQEEMNRYMANQTQKSSNYSLQTVPVKTSLDFLLEKNIKSSKEKPEKSKYSTFSVPAKPIVYPEQKFINNNYYQNQKNNIIEYAPNIINQNQNNYRYNYSTPKTVNYNNLINQNTKPYNYSNYNNYNYSNSQSNYQYQKGYNTKNSYGLNQLYSKSQNQYNNYQYQTKNYQYQTPKYQTQNYQSQTQNYQYRNTNYYPQSFQQFEQGFAEVIPLNPINEYLLSQMKSKPKEQKKQQNETTKNNEKKEAEKEAKKKEEPEELFKTEDGKIIFKNGILKGIIQKYSEIDKVILRIQDTLLKGAKFTLLYKATTDGDKASVFHEKCDNHPMTLVIVETTKGVRFGGFTKKSWEGKCVKKIDNDAFVFSVDNNKIYDIILNEPAMGGYPKFGPVFFGCQIRIYDEFFKKGGSTCYSGLNYKTSKDFELNNGEQTYIVKDIEVYNIEPVDV